MKRLIKKVILFFLCLQSFALSAEFEPLDPNKKLALEVVASLMDNIATLVMNQKNQKDPEVTKACCVALVISMTDAIVSIIQRVQENKHKRSLDAFSDDEYQEMILLIVQDLESKI